MQIFFIRHSFANWPSWPGNDAERPLTSDGFRRWELAAAGLARRLARENVAPEAVLHSPLLRAAQTADILARHLNLEEKLIAHRLLQPGFNGKALKGILKEYVHSRTLACVGHTPDMGEVVMAVTERPVTFREGTVACVKLRSAEHGSLIWSATIDELAGE
jgi:phosphohistidine phosphatase